MGIRLSRNAFLPGRAVCSYLISVREAGCQPG
jgi:hypothetical protein